MTPQPSQEPIQNLQQVQDSEALEAQQLVTQGEQEFQQGQPQKAFETFQQALELARRLGDQYAEGEALNNIAFMYNFFGQPQKALEIYNQTLVIRREIGDRKGEGITLNNLGEVYVNLGQFQKALDYYQQGLAIFKEIRDRHLEAKALNNLGGVYQSLGQIQKALDFYNKALPIFREVGDRVQEGTILNNIGGVYVEMGQLQKALEVFGQALPIIREVRATYQEAIILNNLGETIIVIGKPQKALDYLNQALSIFRNLENPSGEATVLNNIAAAYERTGQFQKALDYYNKTLIIFQTVGDPSLEANALNNIGGVYQSLGQPQKALDYYNQALPITQALGTRFRESATLNNIGRAYLSLGQPQKALDFYAKALPIAREVKDLRGEAITLNNMARVYKTLGQLEKAVELYSQVTDIVWQVGDRVEIATNLNNLAGVYLDIQQPSKALNYYNESLSIIREVGDRASEATILNNIGGIYQTFGQLQKALDYYNQSWQIFREVDDRPGEAKILSNIGVVYHSLGQFPKALDYFKKALPTLQKVGFQLEETATLGNIGMTYRDLNQSAQAINYLEQSVKKTLQIRQGLQRQYRQSFVEVANNNTIALVDLLIEQTQPEKAFEWANLITTFDLADYNRLIDAKVANSETQKALDNWKQQNQQLQRLRSQLEDNFSDNLARRIRDKEAEVFQLAEEIINRFPDVAELFETTPTDLAKLQETIPKDTLVIQPVLLTNIRNVDNTIAFFLVTQDSLKVIQHKINPEKFNALVTTYRTELATDKSPDVYETSGQLYQLLIAPIEAQLKGISPKKLAIIATGKLRYIPFETLYNEQTDKFLLHTYPIHYLTRISTNQRLSDYSSKTENNLQALALANPKPFLFNTAKQREEELKGTEIEADFLQNTFPGSRSYKQEKATLDTFKTQAFRFPLIHLGTHGCFNSKGCPNFGMEANTILFANNEQYHIRDAALLGLTKTEIIVLSACQTAKEAESDGLKLSGLAFVFERAGAKSVMASLWSAEDTVSAEITTQFYTNLKQGMSKSEALRQAKLSHLKTGEKSHPFFWSPFILIGEEQ